MKIRKNVKPLFYVVLAFSAAITLAACSSSVGSDGGVSTLDLAQPKARTTTERSLYSKSVTPAYQRGVTMTRPADASTPTKRTEAIKTAPVVKNPVTKSMIEDDVDALVAAHGEVLGRIYETALPSVVRVEVEQSIPVAQSTPRLNNPENLKRFFGVPKVHEGNGTSRFVPKGEGSGFVWSKEGHIITNWHVINDADRVTVIFADGSEYQASVIGADPDADLAVLKINEPYKTFKPLLLGDSMNLKVGQLTAAIGAPFGLEFSMTRGIISALGRTIAGGRSGPVGFRNPQAIQTDTPINPGNSGGPLLDRHGQVIGINSQIISSSGSNSGVSFAVPINTAKRVVPELIENGNYEYAYLGISGTEVRDRVAEVNGLPKNTRGVLVIIVTGDSPADRAGVGSSNISDNPTPSTTPRGGDIITAIDGVEINTMADLIAHLVETKRPGDKIKLKVLRDGGQTEIPVILGRRPEPVQTSLRPS